MEVAKSTEKGASMPAVAQPTAGWGTGMGAGISAKDVLIPKILIMQPMSQLVVDEKAKPGELVRSTSGEVLGGKGAPVAFIPLYLSKVWVLFQKEGDKPVFRGVESYTPENADLPWEFKKDGKDWVRNAAINLYALLPSDVLRQDRALTEMAKNGTLPDSDDALIPVMIQFTRTSFSVGKEVVTHFAKAETFGIPAAAQTLALDTEKVSGDKGTYYIFKLTKQGKTTDLALAAAKKWFGVVSQGNVRVDNTDLEKDDPAPRAQTTRAPGTGRTDF